MNDDYISILTRQMLETAEGQRRANALKSLNKSNEAARKKERRAGEQDDPAVARAMRQQARADASLARAKFQDAVSEGVSVPVMAPPRGRRADHLDAQGRMIAWTEWTKNELVTRSATGAVLAKTVIK